MRAIWSGHVTFGLITIPVGLYAALESAERVSFRMLHRKDNAPIEYRKFCSAEQKEVPNEEIVKGLEVEKGRFALVEKEELEKVEEELGESDRTIDVLQFVDFASLNPLSFEKPYYLAPSKGGEKAYGVLRDALLEAKKVGIARFFLRTRPLLGALIPGQDVLSLEVLRSFEELRDPGPLKVPSATKRSAEVKMARMLIDQMSSEAWDPTQHPDEYRAALEKLLAPRRAVAAPTVSPETKGGEVVDLMAALKASLQKTAKGGAKPERAAPRAAAHAPRRPRRSPHRKAGAA